ncbi:hypothetical protein RUM43_010439 [Polyplax serrata]|uniref:Methyltransferase type 11 domain-containing protein n=1 Tax=Polyplax serrata TaxID=468196 RepID=A0AAN8S787_POLSC
MNISKIRISARSILCLKNFIRNRSTTTILEAETTKLSTLDDKEVTKHVSIAEGWWDEHGDLKALHSMNKLRIQLVRDGLLYTKTGDIENPNGPRPLNGVKILDVGCGGGILSEPLARIGAEVTGIDPGQKLIEIARSHAAEDPTVSGKIKYLCESVEDHANTNKEKYDAVVASEVIEHVTSKELFLESCSNVLKSLEKLIVTYQPVVIGEIKAIAEFSKSHARE